MTPSATRVGPTTPPAPPPRRAPAPTGNRRLATGFAVLLLLAGLALGARHWLAADGLPPDVPTALARRGEFLVTVTVRGSLTARRSVELDAPDINGLQIVWLAPTGSVVEAGQPVAKFDSSTARQSLDAKNAALQQAQATLDQVQATAAMTAQQDALDLATAHQTADSAALDASKAAVVSQIDGQESDLALAMAREKLKVEQAAIAAHQASSDAKIASARRLRDKAQADLKLVQDQLRQMELDAPLAGVVNYLTNYSQGYTNAAPFKAGDSVWNSATIAEIPDLASLELLAKVSEVDRGRVKIGDELRAHMDALPEVALSGRISSISALAESDFGNVFPPPQIFRLAAQLGKIDPRLRPDMNGSVDIVTQRLPDAIAVPAAALFTIGGLPVVYAAGKDRFVARAVRVVARNPDEAAVAGLGAGTRVALADPTVTLKKEVKP